MQSKAKTVEQYLSELPAERRAEVEKVRAVLRKNIGKGFEEGMGYGMMGYSVPHSIYPAGYHCDPSMPLPYAGLAAQKNGYSLYVMSLYIGAETGEVMALNEWFHEAWKKSGKKLDMGKSCIRFKKADELALDVVGELMRRVPVDKYLAAYETVLAQRGGGGAKKASGAAKSAASGKPAKTAAQRVAKKSAKKTTKKVAKKAAAR